jgi:hypothetical protein
MWREKEGKEKETRRYINRDGAFADRTRPVGTEHRNWRRTTQRFRHLVSHFNAI